MGWTRGALVVLSLLVVAHSFQETRLEDVIGEYNFRMFQNLFVNTTQRLLQVINRLETTAAKEASLSELKESVKDISDSLVAANDNARAVRESVNNGADATKIELRIFQDQILGKLSDVKLFVEHKTKQMEDQVAKLRQMSVNNLAGDCQDLYDMGFNASGVYYLQKFGRQVLCDMESGQGGWLVIQRRAEAREQVDFNRDWHEYKAGFGDLESEFWAGNDFLHVITNQKSYELYINMEDYEKGPYWASYSTFRVGNESSGYVLDIGNYSGNVKDAFTYHHGRPFTSIDRDNDLYSEGNCAMYFSGAWWYDRCYEAHLNGVYPTTPDRLNASFISWWNHEDGKRVPLVLSSASLKIKPRVF